MDLDKLLTLFKALAPVAANLVPGAGQIGTLALIVAQLIEHIRAQTGKTTDQILADAGVTLDDNEKQLLADIAEDQAEIKSKLGE